MKLVRNEKGDIYAANQAPTPPPRYPLGCVFRNAMLFERELVVFVELFTIVCGQVVLAC